MFGLRPTKILPAPVRKQYRESPILLAMASGYKVEKTADLEGGAARYRFSVDVPAELTKASYGTIMKDFKKNAKFPGFRVGTVPAFMLPKVRSFVILECLERTLKDAVQNEGLELANSEKKPTLDDEQVANLTKSFKETEGFSYSIEGEFKAAAAAAAADGSS
jgi:FKBP-type peptidyl-prolyl cis-trans isomerase (trigger factor)